MMSLSVMSPAASSRTLIFTSSVDELCQRVVDGAQRARHVGLEDDPQLLGLAGLDLAVEVLEGRPPGARAGLRAAAAFLRASTWARAIVTSGTTRRTSPASGTSDRPRITAADAGPAFGMRLPAEFSSALILPNVLPATTTSPTRSVPVWTMSVATGPRPLSRRASMMVPTASRFGLALSSWRSATSRMISSSSSMPTRVLADTGTSGVSPP